MPRIVILGGGPAGYEAALVAAELGADVTVVEQSGIGGACVLTDCVPSKTLIASAEQVNTLDSIAALGVDLPWGGAQIDLPSGGARTDVRSGGARVDLPAVNHRVKELAHAQSRDIAHRLVAEGVRLIDGHGRLAPGGGKVLTTDRGGREAELDADVVLLATGASPRVLPDAVPDGERILSWSQLYELPSLPERLVVIGSGVTGAEFADAYLAMGCDVVLVSSRDRVLPGEDADAAMLVGEVFVGRGMQILARSRAAGVRSGGDGVVVELTDGRLIEGSHALLAVGSVPNTTGLGLAEAGVHLDDRGYVTVDRVSRSTAPGVYAAGDCTGVLPLASVAAMQGRIAMWHALGEEVTPLRLSSVAATVFTAPEIATVGPVAALAEAGAQVHTRTLPLATNARAKMADIRQGFVKLYSRPGAGTVLGGVVVAPRASELILPVSLAVRNALTVAQVANSFAVYPSLSGSLTEAARQLMEPYPA